MNQIKKISHKNKKYKYIFCDIIGLINFFKSNILFVINFEKLLQAHRENKNFKYTEIINENIKDYWLDKTQTYYQIIWNPTNLDLITILRAKIVIKDNDTKVCILSMVDTNTQYRNLQFCQKNISMLKKNSQLINQTNPINKFILYVYKDNIPAIKCYKKCGFKIIELVKNIKYLMEIK